MNEKKEFWINPADGIRRPIPSSKYKLTKTVSGRMLYRYIIERDNNTCRICGEHPEPFPSYRYTGPCIVVDHILTRKHGGTHHPQNLQAICDTCNARKLWFDRNPTEITRLVKAVMQVLKDTDGRTLLWILTMLELAKVVDKDASKRVRILIGSRVLSEWL
ncbi:MAG: HNH endonuclease [Desulfobacteraceae bacterium]|nr:HNH endonuclease [Desulfobacteraceae bacterium]